MSPVSELPPSVSVRKENEESQRAFDSDGRVGERSNGWFLNRKLTFFFDST